MTSPAEPSGERPELQDRPRELARTFNRVANDYEARPPYPHEVFERLAELGALYTGANVLEIGPGTGQATIPMLDRGAVVTAVEPGAALADRLLERTPDRPLQVLISAFEAASLPHAAFDLVTAATAFHWVDPIVGPAKCAEVLRVDGWLALWWTIWGDPARPDPLHEAIQPLLRTKAPHLQRPEASSTAYLRDLAARADRVAATNAFGPVTKHEVRWEAEHDAAGLRRLFGTFALWIALPTPLRRELLDDVEHIVRTEFAGTVRRPYLTVLYTAQRRAR